MLTNQERFQTKIPYVIIFGLLTLFFCSCSSNPNSPSSVDLVDRAIYSLNQINTTNHYKVRYAKFDSLNNFRDLGFDFELEYWHSRPAHYISSEYRLYLIANFTKLYFIDIETNTLIKEISLPFAGNFLDSFIGPDMFLQYDTDHCMLIIDKRIYLINLRHSFVELTIFKGESIDPNLIILDAEFTKEKDYLYLITQSVGQTNLSQQLYKINLLNYKVQLVAQLASERTGIYSLGVSDEFIICTEGQEIKKFSIRSDELVMQKIMNDGVELNFFIPWTNNNSLLCRDYLSKDFFILDCDSLEISKYWELDLQHIYGDYKQRDNGLYCLVRANSEGINYVLNLTSKEIELEFYNPRGIYVLHE